MNRREKQCKKQLLKMGLKPMEGVNRVSIKRRDGLVFVIQDPEIFKNPNATGKNDSYVILGEMRMDEPKVPDMPTAPVDNSSTDNCADSCGTKATEAPAEADGKEDKKVSEVPSASGDDKKKEEDDGEPAVSYTHLTLPTIYSV